MASGSCRIKIKGRYAINTNIRNILGRGSYGIVYKAFDEKEKTAIAAKSIDGERHRKVFTDNRQHLLQLDHRNVIQIQDLHQANTTFWIIMGYCRFGDLNTFFQKRNPTIYQKLDIMSGIAHGIAYLHAQNVIHRDIKPDNILMASNFPPVPKLADFDLGKSLNSQNETMNSNVGTLFFKAPEFFKRTDGKLRYHRNVDIFAAGLTFLAMIQTQTPCTRLIPHIETLRDDSEIHNPIGQLIAERIKYKVPELNIITLLSSPNFESCEEEIESFLRKLVSQMTRPEPKNRLSAEDVLTSLGQYAPVQIFVRILGSGKTICLQVKNTDTIGVVKSKVEAKEGIPPEYNRLWFTSKWLQENRRLRDYNIKAESTLVLVVNLYGGDNMIIYIRTSTGKTFQIQTSRYETMSDIKEKVWERDGIPPDQQRYVFNGVQLGEGVPLAVYNIRDGSIICLVLRLRGGYSFRGFRVCVKYFKTLRFPENCHLITVADVKAEIEKLESYPVAIQRLVLKGKVLGDDYVLGEHDLELVLHMSSSNEKDRKASMAMNADSVNASDKKSESEDSETDPASSSDEDNEEGPESLSEEDNEENPESSSEEYKEENPESLSEEYKEENPKSSSEEDNEENPESSSEEYKEENPESSSEEYKEENPESSSEEDNEEDPESSSNEDKEDAESSSDDSETSCDNETDCEENPPKRIKLEPSTTKNTST